MGYNKFVDKYKALTQTNRSGFFNFIVQMCKNFTQYTSA